jgi:pyruvate kinase
MERRTKIVGTVGPASWDAAILQKLIEAGLDVVRLNFSHADHTKAAEIIKLVRELAQKVGRNVAILQDLQGPRIRTGVIDKAVGTLELQSGQTLILTTRAIVANTNTEVGVDYSELPLDVKPGDIILIDDGLIQLKVRDVRPPDVECEVITGGRLGSHKGINIPGVTLRVPTITAKDEEDLKFGLEQGVDYVALSFVRQPHDILNLRTLMRKFQPSSDPLDLPTIIAKIEKHEAIANFDAILAVTDGIMVARGDLGVEMPTEQIPILQKMIIHKCKTEGKTVITATQMLDSMIRNPRPTRAEASDVANAILDGTDATMLSGESANGLYPLEAVQVMSRIAETVEQEVLFKQPGFVAALLEQTDPISTSDAISQAVCRIAQELKPRAIVTTTTSGHSTRMVARNRPDVPIVAITSRTSTFRRMALVWGVQALLSPEYTNTDDMIRLAEVLMREQGMVKPNDRIVITGGVPVGKPGHTNLIKVQLVSAG